MVLNPSGASLKWDSLHRGEVIGMTASEIFQLLSLIVQILILVDHIYSRRR